MGDKDIGMDRDRADRMTALASRLSGSGDWYKSMGHPLSQCVGVGGGRSFVGRAGKCLVQYEFR